MTERRDELLEDLIKPTESEEDAVPDSEEDAVPDRIGKQVHVTKMQNVQSLSCSANDSNIALL